MEAAFRENAARQASSSNPSGDQTSSAWCLCVAEAVGGRPISLLQSLSTLGVRIRVPPYAREADCLDWTCSAMEPEKPTCRAGQGWLCRHGRCGRRRRKIHEGQGWGVEIETLSSTSSETHCTEYQGTTSTLKKVDSFDYSVRAEVTSVNEAE